jgi:hypothetical protein
MFGCMQEHNHDSAHVLIRLRSVFGCLYGTDRDLYLWLQSNPNRITLPASVETHRSVSDVRAGQALDIHGTNHRDYVFGWVWNGCKVYSYGLDVDWVLLPLADLKDGPEGSVGP